MAPSAGATPAPLALALALPWGALAHGTGSHAGFVSTVSVVEPFLPGLVVRVLGGHDRLSVTNLTEKTVVVLDADGGPLARIGPGETRAWSEPRIGATEPPPEREGPVRSWRIPGTADGEPFAIVGFLGFRPPAAEASGGGVPTWAIVVASAACAMVLAALALPLRRRKGEDERGDAVPTEP